MLIRFPGLSFILQIELFLTSDLMQVFCELKVVVCKLSHNENPRCKHLSSCFNYIAVMAFCSIQRLLVASYLPP